MENETILNASVQTTCQTSWRGPEKYLCIALFCICSCTCVAVAVSVSGSNQLCLKLTLDTDTDTECNRAWPTDVRNRLPKKEETEREREKERSDNAPKGSGCLSCLLFFFKRFLKCHLECGGALNQCLCPNTKNSKTSFFLSSSSNRYFYRYTHR